MLRTSWILASLVALSLAPTASAGDTYGTDAEIIAEGLYAARKLGPSPEVTTVPTSVDWIKVKDIAEKTALMAITLGKAQQRLTAAGYTQEAAAIAIGLAVSRYLSRLPKSPDSLMEVADAIVDEEAGIIAAGLSAAKALGPSPEVTTVSTAADVAQSVGLGMIDGIANHAIEGAKAGGAAATIKSQP